MSGTMKYLFKNPVTNHTIPSNVSGRVEVVRPAVTKRSGSSTKGRTPDICYFVAKICIVTIYSLFERLL